MRGAEVNRAAFPAPAFIGGCRGSAILDLVHYAPNGCVNLQLEIEDIRCGSQRGCRRCSFLILSVKCTMTNIVSQELGLLPLEVAHTSFLLERLGQDCEPQQYLRELTQNSLEAIARSGANGEILWKAAPVTLPSGKSGLKLSITDSGDGMTATDLENHINRLSSSGRQQTHEGNFGVGRCSQSRAAR